MSPSRPLVSVIMPCYNGRDTLPMALASLICQTYENWELVFVDDGSSDGSAELAESVGDPRIRVFRLDRNYGRGVTYQRGNDEARGELVAVLDADDWWYSDKLEKQIGFLFDNPQVSLVGGGMVIVNENGEAVGCRSLHSIAGSKLAGLRNPPLAYATVCMKREIARQYSYNPEYRLAQDKDFLQRVCLDNYYANLPEPIYVYTEYLTFSWEKVRQSFGYRIAALKKFSHRFPIQSRREILKIWAKLAVYWIAHTLRQDEFMIARRSRRPTEEMLKTFAAEKQKVETAAQKLFKKDK